MLVPICLREGVLEGHELDSTPNGMGRIADDRLVICCQKHLELRNVFKVFTVQEAGYQLIAARHGFDERLGKALVFLHLNGRDKPCTLEPSNIVVYALVLLLHERLARCALGIGVHDRREDIEERGFAVAAGAIEHEHCLLRDIAGQRVAERFLHIAYRVRIALRDRFKERVPKRRCTGIVISCAADASNIVLLAERLQLARFQIDRSVLTI